MGKYFGTDGFRGEAGVGLTSEQAYKIGRFLGWHFSKSAQRVRAVIGKDTRRSSYMLEYAVAAGLSASGADAYMLHVTTTPSVSFATAQGDFSLGIMISASHNPYYDNGIKILNSKGEKLDEKTTEQIEKYLDGDFEALGLRADLPFAKGAEIGEIVDYTEGRNRYIGYLISLSQHSFKGLRVGLDCANGGAWMIAKSVFDALGAKTYVINAEPNGLNINRQAGSVHIEHLQNLVRQNSLDLGFAFDGDADRCICVDERGEVADGDHILYILATSMKARSELKDNTVVTTVMSNLGLYKALEDKGISHVQTAVGDRYVYEKMQECGYTLGGEQSGHIIISKYATTGDGILTAIKVTEAVIEGKTTLARLKEPVVTLPQVTKSLRVTKRDEVIKSPRVIKEADEIAKALGKEGRLLLRKSGTEPVIRIMVEAQSEAECNEYVERMVLAIREVEEL